MKTVEENIVKAVNGLKGDISNTDDFCGRELFVCFIAGEGRYGSCFTKHQGDNDVHHVCSIVEFNALVAEMETNFGKYTGAKFDASKATELEPQQPVYTQEMLDNGVLPGVGMECMIRHAAHDVDNLSKVEVRAVTGEYLIVKHENSKYEQHYRLEDITFKPLPPKQELIDGEAYQFEFKGEKFKGICNTSIKYGTKHVMLESPINNSGWNSEYCTNITLLTPEGK